ncbi:MAG: ribosome maturation factor RimM [Bacilli bacterium]|nr:ribosome maturation factor RimM [Bacilli bacterium]
MELLAIAYLQKTFGLQGAFKAVSMTDFPDLRFKKGRKYFLLNDKTGEKEEVTLASFRNAGDTYIIRFAEIQTIDEAERFLKRTVNMDKADAPMPKDTFRLSDLIGCKVIDQDGNPQGEVKDVLDYAPTKSLRIERKGDKDYFVPFVDKFITDVDVENKTIRIEVVEGML